MESNKSSDPTGKNNPSYNEKDLRNRDATKPKPKKANRSLRKSKYLAVRIFAKTGYTIWMVMMAIGLTLAFIVSLFLL